MLLAMAAVRVLCLLCGVNCRGPNGKVQHSRNVFRSSAKEDAPATRLKTLLGVTIEKGSGFSETICYKCDSKLSKVRQWQKDAEANTASLDKWRRLLSAPKTPLKQTPQKDNRNKEKKRGLIFTPGKSPAHKQTRMSVESRENIAPRRSSNVTNLQVLLQYPSDKHPRVIELRGDAKTIVQQVVENSWSAAANSALRLKNMGGAIQHKVAQRIKQEVGAMAGNSILGKTSTDDLVNFKLDTFAEELEAKTPWLNACLKGACGNTDSKPAKIAKCTAAAVCAKAVHPTLSAWQYRNSIVLLHGGAKKKTFKRLNKQNICMSHSSSIQKQSEFGKNRDRDIIKWKKALEAHLGSVSLLKELNTITAEQEAEDEKTRLDLSGNTTISSADLQACNFSFKVFAQESTEQHMEGDICQSLGVAPLAQQPPEGDHTAGNPGKKTEAFASSFKVFAQDSTEQHMEGDICQSLGVAPLAQQPPEGDHTAGNPGKKTEAFASSFKVFAQDSTEQHMEGDICQSLGVAPLAQQPPEGDHTAGNPGKKTELTTYLQGMPGYTDEVKTLAVQAISQVSSNHTATKDIIDAAISSILTTPLQTFQLIFDNLDFQVTAKHQSKTNKNKSIHWVHQYAAKDRVLNDFDSDKQQKPLRDLGVSDILPTEEVQNQLRRDYIILVSRVMVTYLSAFEALKGVVVKHIPHPYTEEMSKASIQTWLGLQFKNENLGRDMVEILRYFQTHYVPSELDDEGRIQRLLLTILLGGDWLSEERAENVQSAFMDGDNAQERLDGLLPKFELWHFTRNLAEILHAIFYKESSAGDKGSLCSNMNVVGATSAKKGPHTAYNHNKEFVTKDIDALIVYACMKAFNLESIDARPADFPPAYILQASRHKQRDWLESKAAEIVDSMFVEDAASVQDITKGKLTLALLIRNIEDATKEGDGERISRCFRMALLYFKAYGHTKYAYGTLMFFARVNALLPPKLAHSLVWNRVVSNRGGKGKNIPMDLRLEHMNNFLKSFLKHLGPNLNERSAARVANAVGEMEKLLKGADADLGVSSDSGHHHKGDPSPEVHILVEQYLEVEALHYIPGREYNSFPGFPRDLLAKIDPAKLADWVKSKKQKWSATFENA
ncbi:Hypp553 [Branchiostoma lanceolatum]|uniref:Hypp553 protein n=1 Tax=Branchiostoma lanceolatum TaxID=7740 RepID=A0A8J9VAQ1_BRALA|nr:Hypp553 [Branchiostoma lanceolatum]